MTCLLIRRNTKSQHNYLVWPLTNAIPDLFCKKVRGAPRPGEVTNEIERLRDKSECRHGMPHIRGSHIILLMLYILYAEHNDRKAPEVPAASWCLAGQENRGHYQ